MLVIATSVFEASVTLDVNGVIDTGLATERDFNDFLQPLLCNGAQSTRRRGIAGRIRWSLFKKLRPQGLAESQQQASYRMPKGDQLSARFAAVCLGKEFPVIGISPADAADRYSELRALAVIATDIQGVRRLTDFGAEVRRSSLDVRLGILSAVCSRFDLPWHGRIAAAYVAGQRNIFVRHKTGGSTVGLYPGQLHHAAFIPCSDRADDADPWRADSHPGDAHAVPSDLHTAVKVYLENVVADAKAVNAQIFDRGCIAKMHHHL